MLESILKNALKGIGCTRDEALLLIMHDEQELLAGATQIREHFFGKEVQLCAIVNAKSGQCDMDCRFCSQSAHNSTKIESYPFMQEEELEERIAQTIENYDRLCGVVTSGGRLSSAELDQLCHSVEKLSAHRKAPVCASLGRLDSSDFSKLKAAGITRFHHNLESSKAFYPFVCTTQDWEQRADTVKMALESGLEVCSGGLFGLGESWTDRIDLALELKELGVNSIPINFLYAHPGTPLKDQPPLSAAEALRIIAIYRFMLPTATLRICGGRTQILGDRQQELFAAGANGLMTGNYLTVTGNEPDHDLLMLSDLGLTVSTPVAG